MKAFFTTLLMAFSISLFANPVTYQKLNKVNKLWSEQKDITALPQYNSQTAKDDIRLHLSLVEQILRNRTTANLTPAQKKKRAASLNDLHEYWMAGNFPINTITNYQAPIFIDKFDNFCAVGYLVKASGHEDVSRMIAANTNLAYLRQMTYKELDNWAAEYGFTKDELAWIQPGYDPNCIARSVGQGTDGEVIELYADEANDKLYIGGSFTKVNGTITANNIAYITLTGDTYTWHNMGTGVNGSVHAITKFDNKIYIAGLFTEADGNSVTNIAYWDGTNWQGAGCLNGKVKDLLVYNNELYACGEFDVCAALSEVNFAKWNGNVWMAQAALTGPVNTMETWDNGIVLGGNMTYMGNSTPILKWNPSNGIHSFSNNISSEVNDLETFRGDLYAATKATGNDDKMLKHLISGTWTSESNPMLFHGTDLSFKTLCAEQDTFIAGGRFSSAGLIMYPMFNCINLMNTGVFNEWISVDDDLNKLVVFKGRLYAGGKFKNNGLNGIAYKSYLYPKNIGDIPNNTSISVFPNPATNKLELKGFNKMAAYSIYNTSGQEVLKGSANSTAISISTLPAGTYMLQLQDGNIKSSHPFIKE